MTTPLRVGRLLAFALLGCVSALTLPCAAQPADSFPSRPIRMIVPYPPGGPTDLTARVVAAEMGKTLGQSIVVDNRPGASGMIGAEMVARAEPDGYTFLANASLHVINQFIYPDMRFDALKDFVPITQLAAVPLVLVVPESSPIKTVQDLVEYGRKNPGKLNFGSSGNASAPHLAGESFKIVAGIEMQHVPYKGSAPALADLVGGQIQLIFDSMPSAMPFIKATWYGYWAPKGTPAPIVARLRDAAAQALKLPLVIEQYAQMGAEPVGSTPAEFAAYNASEMTKWEEIVRKSGAKAN